MSEAAVAPARRETDQAAAMAELRRTMVDRQLRPFDVTDAPLLDQFLATPRELFLPEHQADLAYSDLAVTLRTSAGGKRSLLPPLVLARMLQGAAPRPGPSGGPRPSREPGSASSPMGLSARSVSCCRRNAATSTTRSWRRWRTCVGR